MYLPVSPLAASPPLRGGAEAATGWANRQRRRVGDNVAMATRLTKANTRLAASILTRVSLEASMSKLRPAIVVLLLAVASVPMTAQGTAPAPIPSRDAPSHVGSIATICGKVVGFQCPLKTGITFLDLETPSGADGVSVRIPAEARSRFRPRIEDAYRSTNICATGRVEKPGQRYIVTVEMPDALTLAAGQVVKPIFAPNAVSSCDVGVELPTPTHREQPRYTAAALGAQIQGTVLVEAVVRTDGTVGETRVLRSLETGLDQEAVVAVKKWRFEGGTQNGRPTPVIVNVEMSFSIRPR
jgi:TonB family protein